MEVVNTTISSKPIDNTGHTLNTLSSNRQPLLIKIKLSELTFKRPNIKQKRLMLKTKYARLPHAGDYEKDPAIEVVYLPPNQYLQAIGTFWLYQLKLDKKAKPKLTV
jgi:hypothetical protein